MSEALLVWTIYDHPRDFPDHFVVRRWEVPVRAGGPPLAELGADLADTLDQARSMIPPGLARLPRHEADDPVVVETWL